MLFFTIFLFFYSNLFASPSTQINFQHFLRNYQKQSLTSLQAQQSLSEAERLKETNTDNWKSRLEATPQLSFLNREFESGLEPDVSNRSQNVVGRYSQQMPTGTAFELSGQKYLEIQNPLFQSIDRSYSAKITQDLFRNSFGKTQRAVTNKALNDFEVAELEFRNQMVNSCEEAFQLYTDTFIQQQIAELLKEQLTDAQKALSISNKNFKDRLVTEIDKISSESDFIRAKLETDSATQKLRNNKRLMMAYFKNSNDPNFKLQDPQAAVQNGCRNKDQKTLAELIASKKLKSQDFDIERSRSDRWTDVQLGLEMGQNVGRRASAPGVFNRFNEDYLRATLTVGFDLINKTEDSDLRNAIQTKNNLAVQEISTRQTQKSRIDNLIANNSLLREQVQSSKRQVSLLQEKMKIAFKQMKRARLDFESYLLHRNSFIQQKINHLNLKKEFLLNQFAIQKEFAHTDLKFCEVSQ